MQVNCLACDTIQDPLATFECDECGGSLIVDYEQPLDPSKFSNGRTLFEKYGERLPSDGSVAGVEGNTPLVLSKRLGDEFDTEATIHLKVEGQNPTNSFKDRALAPTVSLAMEEGEEAVFIASSGNAAGACAHYAARAGLDCYLLVEGTAPEQKLTQPRAYGAKTIRADGLFDGDEKALSDKLRELADRLDAYMVFPYRPFNPVLMEGVKTISYEVTEQLGTSPDVVVTPCAGGDNLSAQHRGYVELREAGVIDEVPRMVAVQPEGAPPLVKAIQHGSEKPISGPVDTIASGINAPFADPHALEAIRDSNGTAIAVSDDEIIEWTVRTARLTGVWPEVASAAVIPGLQKLIEQGEISPDENVVLTITGNGRNNLEPQLDHLPPVATADFEPEAIVRAFDR